MIREIIKNIEAGKEIRKNLIALKEACKEGAGRHGILYALQNDVQMFYRLLSDTDAKVRKNAAILLGQLGVQESLSYLFEAYQKEETLFVKSSYLKAMRELDYRKYLDSFAKRLEALTNMERLPENRKHIAEEMRILQEMLLAVQGEKKHTFTGWKQVNYMILLTNRDHREITADQLKSHRPKLFLAGVQIKTTDLQAVYQVRTFSEALFVLPDCPTVSVPQEASLEERAIAVGSQIVDSSFLTFLKERHKGDGPFYLRLECKNKMDLKQKSRFAKKLAAVIEEKSKGALRNSTSHYELELRLVENKTGNFNMMVKLYTYEDPRFAYRKESVATSIQPANAALVMALAKPYFKPGAQVLDPFCGVGTMLIERSQIETTGDLYGLDLYGQAIEGGRENASLANVRIQFINRDFFDFRHSYLFDEVVTNMPRVIGKKTQGDIMEIYTKFWAKIGKHLEKNGIIVMHCYDKEIFEKTIPKTRFEVKEVFTLSQKEGAYCMVVQYVS